ncbi:hypothetical protein ACWD6R_10330 [Streptomyces sp. NPDC005151]
MLIGSGIDPDALHKELADCRQSTEPPVEAGPAPDMTQDAAHEQSMWGVLRYVQQPAD